MSKHWGGIGAWAAEAERTEAEEKEQAAALAAVAPAANFPSLKDSVKKRPKKKMTLSELYATLHSLPSYPISSYAWLPFASAAAVFNHSGTNPPNGVPCVVAKNHYEEAQKGRGCGGLLFCMQGWGASYGYVITGGAKGCRLQVSNTKKPIFFYLNVEKTVQIRTRHNNEEKTTKTTGQQLNSGKRGSVIRTGAWPSSNCCKVFTQEGPKSITHHGGQIDKVAQPPASDLD
ncbi:hypothetical protein QQ045_016827 [Rhodiola kirilowii]